MGRDGAWHLSGIVSDSPPPITLRRRRAQVRFLTPPVVAEVRFPRGCGWGFCGTGQNADDFNCGELTSAHLLNVSILVFFLDAVGIIVW